MVNFIKSLILVFFIFIISFWGIINPQSNAQTVLTGSVVKVPDSFFGIWRVVSVLSETDSYGTFKEKGVDVWNFYQVGNVITLSNPYSGASATITVKNVNDFNVEFVKVGKYDNKILTDKVSIKLKGDSFVGSDELILDTLSDVDKSIIKTQKAKYLIKGEKLAGQDILK